MAESSPAKNKFYFSTRDLLIMAVLAALGGVASTYINALSDAVHAIVGFPGATQWAAGLHVIWIVLAMAITGKPGTGTMTGLLKGSVELMRGNSHGVIILLIDLVAGLLVDFGFLLFQNKRSLFAYLVAGGLATASNVLVFQIFATLPENIVAASAILILFLVALASGVIFAGFVPHLVINALIKAGVVKARDTSDKARKTGWYILLVVVILAAALSIYLRVSLQGPGQIEVGGDVQSAYAFPVKDFALEKVSRQMEYKGVLTEYAGYPLMDVIAYAAPDSSADTLLIEATDGYAFLISFDELLSNSNILIVQSGKGKNASFDIVGPESSKAWIRGVANLTVVTTEGLTIVDPSGEVHTFDPDAWVTDMDSTQINLPAGSQKLQGVSIWRLVESTSGDIAPSIILFSNESDNLSLDWAEVADNDQLRLFTVIEENGISFALAEMSGEVHLFPVTQIEIQ